MSIIIAFWRLRTLPLLCGLGLTLQPIDGFTQANPARAAMAHPQHDGQHDFDFEIGAWKVHLSRLVRPLTGSSTWVDYDGTSVVRKVWNGAANLGELEVDGQSGHIEGLSLRLYNPESRQWNISWANRSDGLLGLPMTGEFKDGRGEFFNRELFNGQAIFVRFIFSDMKPTTFRFEQAFSSDGGKIWETNWKATFTK
jgi:hypothetical protein